MAGASFEGLDTLVGTLRSVGASGKSVVVGKIYKTMAGVFRESQKQCPVRTGALKGSGHLDLPDDNGDDVEIAIGYGGPAAEYAAWVHENLQARHRPPTKAKFLEDPMTEATPRLREEMGDVEQAMLRQYPQSPAIAHGNEMTTATETAYGGMSHARRRAAVAHARAFSSSDIKGALARASAHPGRMVRKRKS